MVRPSELSGELWEEYLSLASAQDETTQVGVASWYAFLLSLIDEVLGDLKVQCHTEFTQMIAFGRHVGLPEDLSNDLLRIRLTWKVLRQQEVISQDRIELLENHLRDFLAKLLAFLNGRVKDGDGGQAHILAPTESCRDFSRDILSLPWLKGAIDAVDGQDGCVWFIPELADFPPVWIRFRDEKGEGPYDKGLLNLVAYGRLPISCMLVGPFTEGNNGLSARHFILDPDYLMDVTVIANCVDHGGNMPGNYLVKKFAPKASGISLLLGDIANYFLDRLVSGGSPTFAELFPQVFHKNPLSFLFLTDEDLKQVRQRATVIFEHLEKVICDDFIPQHIVPGYSYLEPAFISETFGIQGRLDLLCEGPDRTTIVELKSGKVFRENTYGINASHFMQFLLYDMLVERPGRRRRLEGFVLYATMDKGLRRAPVNRLMQQQALALRNDLLGLESSLMQLGFQAPIREAGYRLFHHALADMHLRTGFVKQAADHFEKVLEAASVMGQSFFYTFSSFVAREQKLAKTGVAGKGQASLWLDTVREKKEDFNILNHLELVDFTGDQLSFRKTGTTAERANFRTGDTLLLYPSLGQDVFDSSFQLFKTYALGLDAEEITVSLVFPQHSDAFFRQYKYWNLEHDYFDAYGAQYASLFAFLAAPLDKTDAFLGLKPPREPDLALEPLPTVADYSPMTPEQELLLERIIRSKDHFLLWGPPGTGKTSVMIRNLVAFYMQHTKYNLLLLAFTNRAVDELCEAVVSIGSEGGPVFLRLGKEMSASAAFRRNTLRVRGASLRTRNDFLKLLQDTRIIISTLNSLQKHPEIMRVKAFDRVMVDEASQLSEPALAGVLPYFPHFLLVGDHRQLPGIVLQSSRERLVCDEDLQAAGFTDLGSSVFERLMVRSETMGWPWAFGKLTCQGRMHRDIMHFPGTYFYGGMLKILPPNSIARSRQVQPLVALDFEKTTLSSIQLSHSRICFFPTPVDLEDAGGKSNRHEAILISELVPEILAYYAASGEPILPQDIGIITPYRAQIACIREHLSRTIQDLSPYTIDTVERYQGSAREVILFSPCLNYPGQLGTLVATDSAGVDRKLNVALTRARSHFILLGNASLLRKSPAYRELIAYAGYRE